MVPRSVSQGPGKPSFEVFGYVTTAITERFISGVAMVTEPGTGRFATIRTSSTDGGVTWDFTPSTWRSGYVSLSDAERHMVDRSGLMRDTVQVPVASSHSLHPHYG